MALFTHSLAAFVCADAKDVLVWDAKLNMPIWRRELGAPIVGVGSAGRLVLALDANGSLVCWNATDGETVSNMSVLGGSMLAATSDGCAVATPSTIEAIGRNGRQTLPRVPASASSRSAAASRTTIAPCSRRTHLRKAHARNCLLMLSRVMPTISPISCCVIAMERRSPSSLRVARSDGAPEPAARSDRPGR